jgi:hypothetical protein
MAPERRWVVSLSFRVSPAADATPSRYPSTPEVMTSAVLLTHDWSRGTEHQIQHLVLNPPPLELPDLLDHPDDPTGFLLDPSGSKRHLT